MVSNPESPCAADLALCHDLCFGSLKKTKEATGSKPDLDLDTDLAQKMAALDLEGLGFAWDEMSRINSGVVRSYVEQDILAQAAAVTRQDLEHVQHLLSPGNTVALDIKCRLFGILLAQGRYDKARRLNRKVMTESTAALGAKHRRRLIASNHLGVIDYHHFYEDVEGEGQKFRNAMALTAEFFHQWKEAFGERDLDTLKSMSLLAGLVVEQMQWVRAKEIHTPGEDYERNAGA